MCNDRLLPQQPGVGSLGASDSLGRVVIQADRDTVEVAMPSVIELKRVKATFWERLDGSLDFGFDFTQQNAKTDLFLQSEVRYLFNRNRLGLTLDGSFSRQDSVSNITRGTTRLVYLRELVDLWFLIFGGSTEEYDSRPPAADANRNDFSIRTSIGWSF